MLRRAFHVIASHTRSIQMEKNLYHIRYVVPVHDDKLGRLKTVDVKDDEITLTFENTEITQHIKKTTEPKEEITRYNYAS
jgi:hypothetical protein